MIFASYRKWIVKIIELSKEWVILVEFFNRIIDRFEMTKEQNIIFKRNCPKEQFSLKLMQINLHKFWIILFPMLLNILQKVARLHLD